MNLHSLSPADVLAIDLELRDAQAAHGVKFASFHEAYAVLEEEVHELRDEVRKKRGHRRREDIRRELVQIAAMAHRCLASLDVFVDGPACAAGTQAPVRHGEKEVAENRQSASAAAAAPHGGGEHRGPLDTGARGPNAEPLPLTYRAVPRAMDRFAEEQW